MNGDRRKGQVIGQVFIFLLGAFVVGGILLIGYRAIANLGEQQCRAQELDFSRSMERAFDTSLTRGLVRVHSFTLPCGTTELCLVERSAIDAQSASSWMQSAYPLIANSVNTGESASVWVLDNTGHRKIDSITRTLPIADFDAEQELRCFSGSTVTLRFEGRGQTVYVTEDR